jgi:O-antigen/teichoic acid export membrane protein
VSTVDQTSAVEPAARRGPRSPWFTWASRCGMHPASVVGNALSLFGTTVVTSALGFAFWVVAAHLFTPAAIGASGAAISAIQLLAMASMLGLGTLLIGELSSGVQGGPALVTTALITSAVVGIAAGCGFAFVLRAMSTSDEISGGIAGVALFAATTGLSAALLVFDDATLGFSRASWQFWRNLLFSLLKLLALPVAAVLLGLRSSSGLIGTWLAGALLSLIVVALLARRARMRLIVRPRRELFGTYGATALTHHCLNVSSEAPRLLMPVLVAGFLSPVVNARFYTALLLVGFAYIVPAHLSTALFGVGRRNRALLSRELRRTIRISAVVGIGSLVVFGIGGRLLLAMFGSDYGVAWAPLAILGSATFLRGIRPHYIAVCRVNGDLVRSALISCVGSGLEIGVVVFALAMHGGLVLVSSAWVVVMMVEGVILWPTVAVAGGLPGAPPDRFRALVRWMAPRTFGADLASAPAEPS